MSSHSDGCTNLSETALLAGLITAALEELHPAASFSVGLEAYSAQSSAILAVATWVDGPASGTLEEEASAPLSHNAMIRRLETLGRGEHEYARACALVGRLDEVCYERSLSTEGWARAILEVTRSDVTSTDELAEALSACSDAAGLRKVRDAAWELELEGGVGAKIAHARLAAQLAVAAGHDAISALHESAPAEVISYLCAEGLPLAWELLAQQP